MTVSEMIEYLKTLKGDANVMAGDSEYPNENISEDSFTYNEEKNEYVIY